jgi:hypothetical protein
MRRLIVGKTGMTLNLNKIGHSASLLKGVFKAHKLRPRI